jgi:ubiquinone/menaquinone biosynthesis C-methylase UbiE
MNAMVCPWWFCWSFDNPLRRLFHDPERLLAPYVKTGMTAADIGCGMGFFSIGMAKLVGPGGRVIAVDLQPKMLAVLERRARRVGVADRIILHCCRKDGLGIEVKADFVLAFWMAHEVSDMRRFFAELQTLLKPDGRLLLAEPKLHVSRSSLAQTLAVCREAGLHLLDEPSVNLSSAFLFGKS